MTFFIGVFLLSPCLAFAQASIEGKVVNNVTGDGVAKAEVKVYAGRDLRYQASAEPDGSFRIPAVDAGNYTIIATAEGFTRPMAATTQAVMVSVANVAQATVKLQPMVMLRGLVLDPDGKPAPEAQMELFCSPIVITAISGKDGRFQFHPVPPGKCQLSARPARVKRPVTEGDRVEPVLTFFPSSLEPWGEELKITGMTPEQEVEIRLRTARVHRLSGMVLDETGRPVKDTRVQLIRSGVFSVPAFEAPPSTSGSIFGVPLSLPPDLQRAEDSASTGEDGGFEFPSVPDGEWIVRAAARKEGDLPGIGERLGEAQVSLSRFDVENLEIRLASSFTLWATAEWPVDVPMPKTPALFAAMQPVKLGRTVSGLAENDGRIYFDELYPATYSLRVQLLGSLDVYVSAILVGGKDVMGQPVQLSASSGPIRIVLKSGVGSVHGTVEKDAVAFVLLAPADLSSAGVVRVVRTAGRSFEFARVPPGEYLVAAFDEDPSAALKDPARRAGLAVLAKRITVDQRGRVEIELPVRSWD